MRWWQWVQRYLDRDGWTNADLMRATGIAESTIGRWRSKNSRPRPEQVRRVAKAFDVSELAALEAAGLLPSAELKAKGWTGPSEVDLTPVPDDTLLDEVRRRLSARRPRPVRQGNDGASTEDVFDAHEPEPVYEAGEPEPTGRRRYAVSEEEAQTECGGAPSSSASP